MPKRKKSLCKTVLALGTLAFGGMYAANRLINQKACAKNILKKDLGRNYPWRHGDIYYQVTGTGERSLLLIHDATAYSSSYEWNELIGLLSDDFTVYTIDLLGCGRSDKPAMDYTNYLYVQLITSFIKDVIGQPTEVAATGLSASFVTMAALASPDLITKITMINPWHPAKLAEVPDRKSKALGILVSIPILGNTLYNLLNSRSNLEYMLDEEYFYNPFKVRKRLLDACYESSHKGEGRGRYLLACWDGKYLNWNVSRAVSLLKQPVTILYGEKLSKGSQTAKAYKELNPAVDTVAVPLSKMFPQLEVPENVAKLLK